MSIPSLLHHPPGARAALLLGVLLLGTLSTAAHADDEAWALLEGEVRVEAHRWAAGCGALPTAGPSPAGARYLRRTPTTLLPIDDAPPVFGPGVCRALMPERDPWQQAAGPDIACGTLAGDAGRVALRQVGPGTLSVVQQVRLAPTEGCRADVVGTFLLRRVAPGAASVDSAAPPDPPMPEPAPGSVRALAPIPPPALPPPPVAVPAEQVLAVTARAPTPEVRATSGRRLSLFALAGSLVLVGLLGLMRALRRGR